MDSGIFWRKNDLNGVNCVLLWSTSLVEWVQDFWSCELAVHEDALFPVFTVDEALAQVVWSHVVKVDVDSTSCYELLSRCLDAARIKKHVFGPWFNPKMSDGRHQCTCWFS